MEIRKLVLRNFRGFEFKEIEFRSSFTVAIGDNGVGKSTLLNALQVATGAFFLGLPYVYRRHINDDEIRAVINPDSKQLKYFTPVVVEATGNINGSGEFTWRREIPKLDSGNSSKKSDVGRIREIAERYAESINNGENHLLPVIAYFGVKQLGTKVAARKRKRAIRIIIKDGYYNALGQKSDEAAFTQWFYDYDKNLDDNMEFAGTREAVFKAIELAIPFLKNVSFDRYYFQLEADLEIPGQPKRRLLHSYMSDGVKRMLGIVTDLAYRCVILNGFKGFSAIDDTKGVVMIDELDMHLHPNWQRHVVQNLKDAFPSIQFVVTTHSPYIVQSLKAEELINLDFETTISPDTLSLDIVSQEIMGVDSAFSIENDLKETISLDYLELLKQAEKASDPISYLDKLVALENNINDPGLRALLRMNRIAKNIL